MKKTKRSLKIMTITAITAAIALFGAGWGNGKINNQEAEAATQKETINLRIIGTTDLHGQLGSKDYELGVDYNNGGFARVFNLINTTRGELPLENTVTLDAGDVLFDYTTEYIFSEDQDTIQPIYKAMAQIGYDAITLGNHDFDYGYEYIKRQLDGAGLRDIAVVSNVTDSKTGEYPFLENKLITKKMKTSAGNEVEIKVGIIGQTIPTLTSKTHSYTGILKTEDMVANAQVQATKLREMGADIVIALSHTGFGPEEPELNFKNVAYALTKIEEIDVVVCGHEHNLFPTKDMTSAYYKLPEVDKKTYLVNGKNVIMAGDRGKAIGVVDLTLQAFGDSYTIEDRTSEIRLVSESTAKENSSIANSYGLWEEKLLEYSTEVIANLKEGTLIQNYFGLFGDNYAIQLLNDSKTDYATRYINSVGLEYSDYPIVAASTYATYGAVSIDDFIKIQDSITESRLSAIQPYNSYLYIYKINGKQLKEWLEWTASAYETSSLSTKWNNGTMNYFMKQTSSKSLIREDWLDDWSNFYVFDGIDYVIDPSTEPRYDINGNRISLSERVKSIKYNGKEIKNDSVMLLVTNKITQPTTANNGVEKQVVLNGFVRTQSILSKYISRISNNGDILPQLDYNWRVIYPSKKQFIVKAPYYAHSLFQETPWYVEYLNQVGQYKYYLAAYPEIHVDTVGPHIVATPTTINATASPYEVGVQVADESTVKTVRFMEGIYEVDYKNWYSTAEISNNTFKVSENGTYTIYAEDMLGNKSLYQLVIDNFSDNLLGSPTVNTYTNRKTKISGRAEPNTTIVFEAHTGKYESKVGSKGTYSYALPAQPSGTVVTVYVKDKARVLESAHVRVPVKRTGPNQPSVNPIYNNNAYIAGYTLDDDADVIAIIGDYVYVSNQGGKARYEANIEIYNPSLKVIEVPVDVSNSGYFIMSLPPQEAGNTVTLYCMDHLSRNSRSTTLKIQEVAPNAPAVYDLSNIEKTLRGYVPNANKVYNILITIGDNTYTVQSDKTGNFTFDFKEQLYAKQVITIVASDTKNGSTRKSYATKVVVNSIDDYVKSSSTNLTLNRVTDKSYLITGNYSDRGTVYLALANGEGEEFQSTLFTLETDDVGKFSYEIDGKLEEHTNIYVMTRFIDGKILLANKTIVISGRPEPPVLVKEVTNADKVVQIIAKKNCDITLTIGKKTYVTSEGLLEEATGNYIYSLVIDRVLSGTEVTVVATNLAGTSDALTAIIVKAAPELPQVKDIKAGDTKVTGKIELLDYVDPEQTEEQKTPKIFKDAASKVAKTQTRIFASIGKKTYEGTINNKGNFSIKIPKQIEGTVIKVWGTNKAGRGPLLKVITVK